MHASHRSRLAGTRLNMGDLAVTAVAMVDHVAVAKLVSKQEAAGLRKKGGDVSFDVDGMVRKLSELGADPSEFRTDRFDADKAYDYLLEKGHDPEAFMTEQIRMSVSKFLSQQAKDLVAVTYPRIACDTPSVAANDVAQDQGGATDPEAQPNVRDGESTERLAPRTASA